jgi:hypothetical protein
MRYVFRADLAGTVALAAAVALSLPTAAQPPPGSAIGEDRAPPQIFPTPKSEASADTRKLGSVLGIEVRTNTDQSVGRIVDLLAGRSGEVEAAVIEFGGFLGMGSRKIAIEWSALRLERNGKQTLAILDMTPDQLRAAPEYKPERPLVVRKPLPSVPPAETAPPSAQAPTPSPDPPEPSASPPPAAKKAAAIKHKHRHGTREGH